MMPELALVTKGELVGLMRELIVSNEASRCPTRLSDWLSQNGETVGTSYVSELKRHYFTGTNSTRVMRA